MPTQIVMPQLGESVVEGIIGKWLKREGDPIAKDEPIVEVVTDKVNAEIPSPVAGTLVKISAEEGATVLVGEEIAVIGDPGEEKALDSGSSPAREDDSSQSGDSSASRSSPTEAASAGAERVGSNSPGAALTAERSTTGPLSAPTQPDRGGRQDDQHDSSGSGRAVRSSPLVQRLAAEHNVDISQVPGTGIGGRVSKKDILQFLEPGRTGSARILEASSASAMTTAERLQPQARPTATPATVSTSARSAGPTEEYLAISPVRRMIAEHMVKSKFTIPHATSMIEVDMTPVVRYREANKAEWQSAQGISLSFMSFVALATIESLRQHPLVNSEWGGDKIVIKKNINLGLAVAAQNGLIVPNIKNADRLSLGGLAHAINDLTVRARNGKLTPDDVSGGTFTLNNTGAIGSVWSVSVINYPQAGILSADAIVKRVRVMDDDAIAVRHMMNLCMSFDHRTLDGATVSDFLQFIRRRLESWSEECPL